MSHITKVRTTLTNKLILRETLESLGLNWSELKQDESNIQGSTNNKSDIEDLENSGFKFLNSKISENKKQSNNGTNNLKKNPRIDFVVAQENGGSNIIFLWNGESYEIGVDFTHWQQKNSATFFVTRIEQEYALNLLKATAENLGLETEIQNSVRATNEHEKTYTLVCKGWQES